MRHTIAYFRSVHPAKSWSRSILVLNNLFYSLESSLMLCTFFSNLNLDQHFRCVTVMDYENTLFV